MEFSSFKILRLNAELFPITRFEQEKYNEHGMPPMAVEAAARGELVEHVRDADAVMVVSQSQFKLGQRAIG